MDNSPRPPRLIPGGMAVDDRGQLNFANDFSFAGIKRFYTVENFSTEVVRAFHGHLKEDKYVLVANGSAIVAAVALDDPVRPSKDARLHRFVLSDRQPQILHIPAGYANGFRALEPRTKIIFFSTSTLDDANTDDYRFSHDYWGADVWKVEFR